MEVAMDRQTWRGAAKCSPYNSGLTYEEADELFFPSRGKSAAQAKSFCRDCPVRLECLEFSLIYNEQGVFGGTTENERNAYPEYIVQNLRQREALTVGLELRGRSLDSNLSLAARQVMIQVTALEDVLELEIQRGEQLLELLSPLPVELVAAQTEELLRALDLLFADSIVLLVS
jgi:hypothetical protein